MNEVNAQQARAVVDLLVDINYIMYLEVIKTDQKVCCW